jgi:hypothetical protein
MLAVVPFVALRKSKIASDLNVDARMQAYTTPGRSPNRPLYQGEREEQSGLQNVFCLHLAERPEIPLFRGLSKRSMAQHLPQHLPVSERMPLKKGWAL